MKLFIAILFCAVGLVNAADRTTAQNDPTAFIPGREYPVSTNEARPYLMWTGSNSQVRERGCFRIATREEWMDLWLRHTGGAAPGLYRDGKFNHWFVPGDVPQIDFTRSVVVAVFQGPVSQKAGFDVAAVVNQGDGTVLRLVERWSQYGAGPGNSPPPLSPVFGLFVMPRSDKSLVVEENVQHFIGEPLIWKERARFAALPVNKPQ